MRNPAEPWRRLIDSIGPYYGTQLLGRARARERRAVRLDEEPLEAIAADGRTWVDTEPLIPCELVLDDELALDLDSRPGPRRLS